MNRLVQEQVPGDGKTTCLMYCWELCCQDKRELVNTGCTASGNLEQTDTLHNVNGNWTAFI